MMEDEVVEDVKATEKNPGQQLMEKKLGKQQYNGSKQQQEKETIREYYLDNKKTKDEQLIPWGGGSYPRTTFELYTALSKRGLTQKAEKEDWKATWLENLATEIRREKEKESLPVFPQK